VLPPALLLSDGVPSRPSTCMCIAHSGMTLAGAQLCRCKQVRAQPLPCAGAQLGVVYDLHAAHAESGATDEAAFPFVPPQWRPFNEHVPQIPGTFPVWTCVRAVTLSSGRCSCGTHDPMRRM
jgi:hypothetical protein